ncbi:hypothetical protein [Budvicia diplopodorum]|uniref:hypothetical protein n=1 Tax=Budvicia diplopodorum TaxID=1119056 RepID=UPI00135CC481|nr:hypothetical protein [Budvicia diplopodorum]
MSASTISIAFAAEPDVQLSMQDRRNPFIFDDKSECRKEMAEEGKILSGWRLYGTIGQMPDLRGWIKSSSGEWVKIFTQAKLPLLYWQLSEINSGAVLFSSLATPQGFCNTAEIIELRIRK